eukprot:gene43892-38688_t
MTFAEDILQAQAALEALGYDVSIPRDTHHMIANPDLPNDLDADLRHCIERDELRASFALVARADAVVVLNKEKRGVRGYVGTSVLMELARVVRAQSAAAGDDVFASPQSALCRAAVLWVGTHVTVLRSFVSNDKHAVLLTEGQTGVVRSLDEAGDAGP